MVSKKGQLAGGLVTGILGMVFLLTVAFVMITQLTGSGLLTANSAEDNVTDRLVGNLTSGVDQISGKVPTFFTIIAAVLILGFVVYLYMQYKRMNLGGSGTL